MAVSPVAVPTLHLQPAVPLTAQSMGSVLGVPSNTACVSVTTCERERRGGERETVCGWGGVYV